jgi:hypothetical protein
MISDGDLFQLVGCGLTRMVLGRKEGMQVVVALLDESMVNGLESSLSF